LQNYGVNNFVQFFWTTLYINKFFSASRDFRGGGGLAKSRRGGGG